MELYGAKCDMRELHITNEIVGKAGVVGQANKKGNEKT